MEPSESHDSSRSGDGSSAFCSSDSPECPPLECNDPGHAEPLPPASPGLATVPEPKPNALKTKYDELTSSLEFEDFSFMGADGSLEMYHVSGENRELLHEYLGETYDVCMVDYQVPLLVLSCEKLDTPVVQRPFIIAGLVAIWKTLEYPHPLDFPGEHAWGPAVRVDPKILELVNFREDIPDKVILYLADHIFPTCDAITVLWDCLVIELPRVSNDEFAKALQTLPIDLEGFPFSLCFHNGSLLGNETGKRAIMPLTHKNNPVVDDTDYVKSDQKFWPGRMLSAIDDQTNETQMVTAGILIQKTIEEKEERRLTCSFHNWEKLAKRHPEKFGTPDDDASHLFRVMQGSNPGTNVGFVSERIGETDIALARLHPDISFENKFMQIEAVPKIFLPGQKVERGDLFVVDSFVTGKQPLFSYGCRYPVKRRVTHDIWTPEGVEGPSPNVAYISLQQNAFVAGTGMWDGMCGSVLLRTKSYRMRGESPESRMKRGEIAGMMHWANLTSKFANTVNQYICYADAFDPLIEDGWTIVHEPELPVENEEGDTALGQQKRKADSGDEVADESSAKKQKV
ncbi:hypothetical protein QQX98_002878 [Neonectria punicea]|uniref:Uncharacterized protein n=1 Tax=Neonectria punicea TaxID=979145 RepID=A0ABR1HGB4_9HYPO